ncbi:hypothetical protein Tco_1521912 [Tanacetum coccineum]
MPMASFGSSDIIKSSEGSRGWRSRGILYLMIRSFRSSGDKSVFDASAKLTRAKLNKRSGDIDLSKEKSGPESPPEFQRSCPREGPQSLRRSEAETSYPTRWEGDVLLPLNVF